MKNSKGFTLVEIIVTVVILSVLMAVAVPVSLSFMDDIREKQILNEAQNVYNVAKSSSKSNRLSLQGGYIHNSGTYYELDSSIRASFVTKAKGTGEIKKLEYENDDITLFLYKYDETTYIRYSKDTGIFEIETKPDFDTVAEIIMTAKEPSKKINDYFKRMGTGSTIDSEAPSKEESQGKFNGIGHDVYQWLNEKGINSDYFSWKVIFENIDDKNLCEHGEKRVYAMYICEKKITKNMVGGKVDVNVYKFYADGCQYGSVEDFGKTIHGVEIVNKTYGGYTFPVLKIEGII